MGTAACAAAEHALQRLGRGAGPDAEAEAAEAAPAGLDQRSPGVGLAVATLVAVVVGEPVRQHDQQPSRRAPAFLQQVRAVADRRPETGVGPGHEPAQALDDPAVEAIVEPLRG